jgi:hypothetical protein
MVTAGNRFRNGRIWGATVQRWNRHYLTSLAVDLQNQETITLHIRVRINLTAG